MDKKDNELSDIKFMPRTTEHILGMTEILADETSDKHDVLSKLADAKISMFKEDQELRREMVSLQTELVATKRDFEKAKQDNIMLVDKIRADRDYNGGAGVAFEDEKAKAEEELKARKRKETYDSYVRQFGKAYAEKAMEKYQD